MICLSVLYANAADKRFDHDYYARKHMPMVLDTLKAHGMTRYEIDRGISGVEPGSAPAYLCIGRCYFETLEGSSRGLRTTVRNWRPTFRITPTPKSCCRSARSYSDHGQQTKPH